MYTLTVDPITAALLAAGSLSFVTVDRPPPVGECDCGGRDAGHVSTCASLGPSSWIGQRVAIYAGPLLTWQQAEFLTSVSDIDPETIPADAIVGSGTLTEALPIRRFGECDLNADVRHICVDGSTVMLIDGDSDDDVDLSGMFPLQSWEPGRWALRFTDVAPTSERCPNLDCLAGGDARTIPTDDPDNEWFGVPTDACRTCSGAAVCPPVVAPVLSGDDPTYKEWTP